MRKVERAYRGLMAGLTGLSLFVCFAVVLASSISRYAFSSPFQWSEEVARYAMIYGTMFGMTLSYMLGSQIRFTAMLYFVPSRLRERLELVTHAAALILGGVLVISGYLFMIMRGGILSSGLGIPMYYALAAMMIGGACLFLAALIKLAARWAGEPAADDGAST